MCAAGARAQLQLFTGTDGGQTLGRDMQEVPNLRADPPVKKILSLKACEVVVMPVLQQKEAESVSFTRELNLVCSSLSHLILALNKSGMSTWNGCFGEASGRL